MIRALYSSAAGMQAQQTNLDVIANNLANVNTSGYKKTTAEFQDLLYQNSRPAGSDVGGGTTLPTGLEVGHGSQLVATSRLFTTGELTQTGNQMDVAIEGDGFFQVQMPDGTFAYTRDGSFKRGPDGRVLTADGLPVSGFQSIPAGATAINIAPTGEVTVTSTSGNQTYRLPLVRFANPNGLQSMGRNLYKDSPASGTPETGNPGENGFGNLRQNYIEGSNVKVVEEMVNMIVAQRAYEVNSKAVQASDEMMQIADNLRR